MVTTRFEPASRKNVDRTKDPYIPRKAPIAVGVCPECHAISRKKRWYVDETEYVSLARTGAVLRRCPACRKIADGFPSGVVTLRGKFLQTHRDEILAIVRNEERRARGTNPLERIMEIREGGEKVEILTTDEKLSQRIGREIRKAYRGSVSYKWSEDANLVRVDWSRDN
ncbi:MAG: ATPase [Deltaproteobacteria bacterium]|nr:ATPase [Deltaproteobacteria bacterium]